MSDDSDEREMAMLRKHKAYSTQAAFRLKDTEKVNRV